MFALTSNPIALQILNRWRATSQAAEGNTKQLLGIEPPLTRLRAQNDRVFFRGKRLHRIIVRRSLPSNWPINFGKQEPGDSLGPIKS